MKAQIIQIGNSQGVRIPKVVLEESKLAGEVELEVHKDGILIRSTQKPRANWDAMFKAVADNEDDHTLEAGPATVFEKGVAMVERFAVYLVNLDTQPSKDAKNTRPCVVISPDEINRNLDNVLVAPLSSTRLDYPTRVPTEFLNNSRFIILDQIRAVDKTRLVKKIGEIEGPAQAVLIERLQEMFAR